MPHSTIHLMRHGEVFNPGGVLYGRLPGYRLSDRGRAMAERVAKHIGENGHDIRAVVASPLERAQESAAPTAQAFSVPVLIDEGLIEAGNDFEGEALGSNRLMLASPRFWKRYRNPMRPSWGEPYTEIVDRMCDAIRRSLDLLPDGGEALLVSHQLPIWVTRLRIEGRHLAHDPRRRECALASLTSLEFEGRRLVGLSYAEPAADLVRGAADMVPGRSGAHIPGQPPEASA
ncbi:MAG TPA: histidine phosphatase family protein [Actinomycetaceae bacterium]|nr:histidine phosphatase family protein [Actinomycetaceae bacterium]